MRAKTIRSGAAFVLAGAVAWCLSAEASDVGQVYVKSKPGRASVYVDQEAEPSGKTPCLIRNVPVGEHTVCVHLDGYADVSEAVDVLPDTKCTVSLTLAERLPADGEDAEGAEDAEETESAAPPAEEAKDNPGDETEEADTGPTNGEGVPKYIKIDCPVCSGTGLLQKMGCDTCKSTGRGNHGVRASCEGTGRVDFRCPDCSGVGTITRGENRVDCGRCKGKGRFRCGLCSGKGKLKRQNAAYIERATAPCAACKGTGFERSVRCLVCCAKGVQVIGKHREIVNCWYCKGDGKGQPRCNRCRGVAVVGPDRMRTACMPCYATGRLWVPCGACKGKGWEITD